VVTQRSEKVKRYVEDQGLPFDILIDDSRDVVKAYGVWHRVGFDAWNIAKPAVFLIDRDGVIRYVCPAPGPRLGELGQLDGGVETSG